MTKLPKPQHPAHDEMVPDPQVCREFGITDMTLYRCTRDLEMGFPPPIKFSNRPQARNFRSRRALEAFKQRMMERAIRERAKEPDRKERRLTKKAVEAAE